MGMPGHSLFKTVILLCEASDRRGLESLLKRHRPRLKVVHAARLGDLEALSPALLAQSRLLAFATSVVVPGAILDALGYGAYNFHPGPPDYPGRHTESFALYEGATDYGATAHRMVERVDAGPILDVELFQVPAGTTVEQLSELTFGALARLFWRLAEPLATREDGLPTSEAKWSGIKCTRRRYAAMCDIPLDISAEELALRVAAFGRGDAFPAPTITLHGVKFRLVREM